MGANFNVNTESRAMAVYVGLIAGVPQMDYRSVHSVGAHPSPSRVSSAYFPVFGFFEEVTIIIELDTHVQMKGSSNNSLISQCVVIGY